MKLITSLTFALSLCPFLQSALIQSDDFEAATVGPSLLDEAGYSVFRFGDSIHPDNTALTNDDPLQGIVATSPLNSGQAGYLGGVNTNFLFQTGTVFGLTTFKGAPTDLIEYMPGTTKSRQTSTIEFLYTRGSGDSIFGFFIFDAIDADPNTGSFEEHSFVLINTDDTITIQDNRYTQILATGITLSPGTAYRLSITVDYDTSTWSSTVTDLQTTVTDVIADARPVNSNDYTLSGYTSQNPLDLRYYVFGDLLSTVSLGDTLYFDNYELNSGLDLTGWVNTSAYPFVYSPQWGWLFFFPATDGSGLYINHIDSGEWFLK